MKNYVIAIFLLFPLACIGNEVLKVDELVVNRDQYDGKDVAVVGVFHLEFESNGLLGEKHYIWINKNTLPKELQTNESWKSFQDKEVLLKAKFSKENDGHLLGTPGKFLKIYSVTLFKK
jgi:hypothetical protein